MLLKGVTGGAVEEATATGNPLAFLTDLARPLKSLLIPFSPKQEGSGDPSPQNVRPIVPWNGLTVWNGKNLLDEANVPAANRYIKYTSPTSAQWAASSDSRSYKWEAEPNTTYTIHAMNPNITVFRVCALENGELSEESTNAFQWDGTGERVCTITTSATEHYLIIQINRSIAIDKKGYVFVAKGTTEENPVTATAIVFPAMGRNIFDEEYASWVEGRLISNNGNVVVDQKYKYCSTYIPIKSNTDYAFQLFKGTQMSAGFTVAFYGANKEFISRTVISTATTDKDIILSGTAKSPTNAYYLRMSVPVSETSDIMVEEGQTVHTYEPFDN
ncbi:MAG: hypothetical protein J6P82_02805, partial [Bacteroidales bacterium]|nr:hypothetical protein [Bacteroidales bacterium]